MSIPALRNDRLSGTDLIFYDGSCALCHATVRFLLRRDSRAFFRFAPLGGETFCQRLGHGHDLPDSLVLVAASGEILTRSDAVLHALGRLGGPWRVSAALLRAIPRPLRDALYNGIARTRYRIFGRESNACPAVPAELRTRFLP